MNERKLKRTPLTFISGLQLLFIGLQLTGGIDWHWWQVLLPKLIEISLVLIHEKCVKFLEKEELK